MKTKTSLSLSDEVLCEIDREIGKHGNRSQFIENALEQYFRLKRRAERDHHDRAILNAIADGRVGGPPDAWEYGSEHYWAGEERSEGTCSSCRDPAPGTPSGHDLSSS